MKGLSVKGVIRHGQWMVITFAKQAGFYQLLNEFLAHLGFMHTHIGKKETRGKDAYVNPAQYVDVIDHLEKQGDAIIVSGLKKAFVFIRRTPGMEKKVKGAVKIFAK